MKKSKIIGILMLVVFVSLTVIFIPGCKGVEKTEKKVIKIGAILPLTGPLSKVGQEEKIGMEMALEEINKGEQKIEVVYEDNMGDVKNSISAAQKLTSSNIDKIILSTTPTVLSILQAYKNNENLFFVAQCMTPNILKGYSNAIRIYAPADKETSLMAEYIKRNSFKKVYMLHINSEFGKSSVDELTKKIASQNIEIEKDTFSFSDKNYNLQIIKIKKYNPDVLVIYSYPDQWPNIIKQISEVNLDLQILGNTGVGFIINDFKELNISKNIIYAAPYYVFSKDDEKVIKFKSRLNQKYGKKPNFDIVYFYDMINILASNIGHIDNIKFLKSIVSREYQGISGKIKFENNDLIVDMKLVHLLSGKIETIEN